MTEPKGNSSRQGWPAERTEVELPASLPPQLIVVIDTEEEFDWHAPFDREATTVAAMDHADRAQDLFDEFGIRPIYVVDYPIASQPRGFEPLKRYAEEGRAVIGAHLHPWVSPPHEEQVCRENSFPGNLPPALEKTKLALLTDTIEANFGERPRAYKAGRYGFGPNTTEILETLGFEIDLSASPPFDYREEGGPDYTGFSPTPYWFGRERRLLGLPSTAAYVGRLAHRGHELFTRLHRPWASRFRMPGIFARLGWLERLRLSPEGFELDETKRLTEALVASGLRVFSLSFHSPSVEPGYTPYVRSDSDLKQFLNHMRQYFDYFLNELGGEATTPQAFRDLVEPQRSSGVDGNSA